MMHELEQFITEFETVVSAAEKFCYMTRAREYQLSAIESLEKLQSQANSLKAEFVARLDEEIANKLLSFHATAQALTSELKMWIDLRDNNSDSAWNHLVRAQVYAANAMCAHVIGQRLSNYVEHLIALERTLFPPLMFFSIGAIVDNAECS